ncbi:MAG TPA: hypothetical protein PKD15_04720 [Candidatus Saccharibacteria bacterium]|nr:hypothetical protein [Candidatus Saccharibacteria bacterium]
MTYKPLEMPEVLVLHHADTPWARWQQAIHSSGIINAPYSIRSMTDTYLGNQSEANKDRLSHIGFNADHLFIEDTLDIQNNGVYAVIHSQVLSSTPHTTWTFTGERVTGLIAAVYNRERLEQRAGIMSSSTTMMQALRRNVGIVGVIMKPLEVLAGRKFPDAERIRHEVSSGCDGPFDVESNVYYHRQQFRKSLIHLEGLRQAIQQRRKN